MTRDDIIRMAREADLVEWMPFTHQDGRWWIEAHEPDDSLERFATLVAAAEREACAKVCDGKVEAEYATGKVDHNEMAWAQSCAIDIRARSNT